MQPVAQMHQMVSGSLALLFIDLEFPEAWLAGPEAWLARPEAWLAGPEYYWSLPSWKAAKENGLVSGVNMVVWGLGWGSPGSQIVDKCPLAISEGVKK